LAVDYRANVFSLRPLLARAVRVRIYKSDLALGLTVRDGHHVVVFGYLGEPLLRLSAAGVAVNESSPTAEAIGLSKEIRSGDAGPAWQPRSGGREIVWHDARLRGLPPGVRRERWAVPVAVDGRRARLQGEIWRVDAPSPWAWLALGAPFVRLTALVLVAHRMPLIRAATRWFGGAAAAGTIATAGTFAFASSASAGRWIEGANEVVFALVGLAIVCLGLPDARVLAGGGLGLLGLSVGLSKVPVLLHGVVLSALPDLGARIAVVLTIWAGAAAAALGLVAFFDVLEHQPEPADLHRRASPF
jgi:hypothetical protein